MEDAVIAGMEDDIFPGAVMLVGQNNRTVAMRVLGNRQLEPERVPMTPDTIFDMASVSKVMGTATATMLLIEDGKLSLDTRAADIVTQFAAADKGEVTIRDLLTHTSGLQSYTQWRLAEDRRTEEMSQADALIATIADLEKRYPTGEAYIYSCLNYLTLARVNEVVAGESQEALLRRRVWEPLGMHDTTYFVPEEKHARLAPAFRANSPRNPGDIHDPLAHYHRATEQHCPGNAGLFSTARDVGRYCRMILNRGEVEGVRVFQPETIDLMTAIHSNLPAHGSDNGSPVPRALGWGVYTGGSFGSSQAPAGSFIGHTGYTGTSFWIDKNSGTYLVLLSNAVYSAGSASPRTQSVRRRVTSALVRALYPEAMYEVEEIAAAN